MSEKNFIKILMDNRMLRDTEEMQLFRQALAKLSLTTNSTILPDLFLVFEDRAINKTPLKTLISFIESFDRKVVVRSLSQATPLMLNTAKVWLTILYGGVLANKESRAYLKILLPTLPVANQQAIRELLEYMKVKDYGDEEFKKDIQKDIEFVLDE